MIGRLHSTAESTVAQPVPAEGRKLWVTGLKKANGAMQLPGVMNATLGSPRRRQYARALSSSARMEYTKDPTLATGFENDSEGTPCVPAMPRRTGAVAPLALRALTQTRMV